MLVRGRSVPGVRLVEQRRVAGEPRSRLVIPGCRGVGFGRLPRRSGVASGAGVPASTDRSPEGSALAAARPRGRATAVVRLESGRLVAGRGRSAGEVRLSGCRFVPGRARLRRQVAGSLRARQGSPPLRLVGAGSSQGSGSCRGRLAVGCSCGCGFVPGVGLGSPQVRCSPGGRAAAGCGFVPGVGFCSGRGGVPGWARPRGRVRVGSEGSLLGLPRCRTWRQRGGLVPGVGLGDGGCRCCWLTR